MVGHLDNYYSSVIFLQLIDFIEWLTVIMQLKLVCSWAPEDRLLSAQSPSQTCILLIGQHVCPPLDAPQEPLENYFSLRPSGLNRTEITWLTGNLGKTGMCAIRATLCASGCLHMACAQSRNTGAYLRDVSAQETPKPNLSKHHPLNLKKTEPWKAYTESSQELMQPWRERKLNSVQAETSAWHLHLFLFPPKPC